jgi:hypothetical protein
MPVGLTDQWSTVAGADARWPGLPRQRPSAGVGPRRAQSAALMARTGHDSERAAMIYQYEALGADQAITRALDAHITAEQRGAGEDDDGAAGTLAPVG